MRIITADLHIHSHLGNPIFINVGIDYLDYLADFAINHEIKNIDILGDLFHISNKINIEIFIPIFEKLEELKKRGLIINILSGNHEIHTSNNKTILNSLDGFCYIHDNYYIQEYDNYAIHYLPFSRTMDFSILNPIKNKNNILMSHFNVGGFKLNEFIISKGIEIPTDIKKKFSYIFLGDLHIHQSIGNITYTGSPYQQNFGEVGQTKGFLLYDEEKNIWSFKKYDNYPKFKILNINEVTEENVKNSFIKLRISSKIDQLAELKEKIYSLGAIDISQEFQIIESKQEDQTIELNVNSDIQSIIKEYISLDNTELDKEKLLNIFNKLILGEK